MHAIKRKASVKLGAGSESLSAQVTAAVRVPLERRKHQRLLGEMLDQLDAEHGPVDEELIGKYAELLA